MHLVRQFNLFVGDAATDELGLTMAAEFSRNLFVLTFGCLKMGKSGGVSNDDHFPEWISGSCEDVLGHHAAYFA